MARRGRINLLAAHIPPAHVFLTGIVVIACFLFQQNLLVRFCQVLAYSGLAVLAGKRIRISYFLIMLISITVFNLFTPVGEILLELGPIVVTRGALRQGLMKGLAIPGLVFISLFAVRPDLRLPGRLGGLVGRLFYYFELLLDSKKRIRLTRFVESVDELLTEVLAIPSEGESAELQVPTSSVSDSIIRRGAKTTILGYLLISILATSSVAAIFLFGSS